MAETSLQLLWLDCDADRVAAVGHWLRGALPGWRLQPVLGAVGLAQAQLAPASGPGPGPSAVAVVWPLPWLQPAELNGLRALLRDAPVLALLSQPMGANTLQEVQALTPLRPMHFQSLELAALGQLALRLEALAPALRTTPPPLRAPIATPASTPSSRMTGPVPRHLQVVPDAGSVELRKQAAVAHDLQEPLRSVASYLQVLERHHGDQLADDGRQLVDKAKAAAQRMAARVRTLVDQPAARQMCDGDAVLQQVVSDLSTLLTERQVQVQYATLGEVGLSGDALARVLQNLLSNAARHGRAGGVVRVTARREVGSVVLRVADDGPGIAPADRAALFNWRSRGTTDAVGHGIGLAGVAELLAAQGGRIWLDETVPVGATFCVSVADSSGATAGNAAVS